ncbi:MAG TPA: glycosyltransferase family 2 protein [Kiritimatiellia bacterium]|nr:glycosyltransferase family 2 protein [Kiritimatiellia bacterium]HMP34423.1 glycosyltransferase family 2 protein [Kiritimatiellia bacterium]
MKLSIIIPVYNEARTIDQLLARVDEVNVGMEKEIVVVDDGSTDGTRDVLPTLKDRFPAMNLIFHEVNQGKGAALRTGLTSATGDILLIQDADLEYDPRDYHTLLAPILEGRADVVYGSRFIGGGAHRVLYFWHMIGNQVITLFSNMMTNLNFTDVEVCYKVFRREVIKTIQIKENRFGFEIEVTAKVAKGKWRIYEVPVSYYGRPYSEGKKITWKDGFRAMWCILKYRFVD